jgi:hypothetical protein
MEELIMDNIQETFNDFLRITKSISKFDDSVEKASQRMKIVLFNLQIEDARIKENTGIVPICEELQRILGELTNGSHILLKDRDNFAKDISVITEFINNNSEG